MSRTNRSDRETVRIPHHDVVLRPSGLCLRVEFERRIEIGSTEGMRELRDVFGWVETCRREAVAS